MHSELMLLSMASRAGWLRFGLSLLSTLICDTAWGQCIGNTAKGCHCQDIDISNCPTGPVSYNVGPSDTTVNDPRIAVCPATQGTNVTWSLAAGAQCNPNPPSSTTEVDCNTMAIKTPSSMPCDASKPGCLVSLSNQPPHTPLSLFFVSVGNCQAVQYAFHSGNGGGWGDPHLTTVDGIHYDFQSAGEFILLRGDAGVSSLRGGAAAGAKLEIQARQTPVATTYIPNANAYTGLQTCVSLYSAVAALLGTHRVSYEPNVSGAPDPTGLQLRVDGVLTTLGPQGIDLGSDGRIVKTWTGEGSIEIDSHGAQLVVTPAYWQDQQKWYLNIIVSGTTAGEGILGKLARGSWLPALSDGTSLGQKPDSLPERYIEFYQKFADSWRVTDATSLFDYGPGQSTATFSVPADWPRENPQSCAIPNQPSAQPVDIGVAEKACSAIVDANMKADCVFDVSVTGFTGFAQTYKVTQQVQPGATQTAVSGDRNPSKVGENVTFTAKVTQTPSQGGGAPSGTVQFILDGAAAGSPVALDSGGQGQWSTSSFTAGQHKILAKYTPTGWGGFVASSSPEESHTVLAPPNYYWWLLLILVLAVIAFFVWRYLRTV
jgi:hypothetical protein